MSRNLEEKKQIKKIWWEPVLWVFLFWYPLRHIHWGIDYWDTGYNFANFQYMGMEHMDPMWLFSTYLANVVGHFMTMLPGADCLAGMNMYTGLFVSALAILAYWFCTRKLRFSVWVTFLGEITAISLCWCPTALLYNYLTYLLFSGCVILLYLGLSKEKPRLLVAAGLCLGSNLFVRFSNLPEAALIVAVWVYAFLAEKKPGEKLIMSKVWSRIWKNTAWCLLGYVTAVAAWLGWITIRYGFSEYIAGITRLFAMTDNATDYKATSMLAQLVYTYTDNLYWIIRIGVIVIAGLAVFMIVNMMTAKMGKTGVVIRMFMRIAWCLVCVAMVIWLFYRGFCASEYDNYGAILRPGITFLTISLGCYGIRILQKGVSKEEKLLAGLLFLLILLTSIGSNNGVYPSLNHLFLVAPYTFYLCEQYVRKMKYGICFPVEAVWVTLLLLFFTQSVLFGGTFVFAEATGARNMTQTISNNTVLKGIKMDPERAEIIGDLSDYIEQEKLAGEEVILFGNIPSVSYYMQMPSAFNPWPDLDSYHVEVMKEELETIAAQVEMGEQAPVVILDTIHEKYMEGGLEALSTYELSAKAIENLEKNGDKMGTLKGYMEKLNYELTYESDKFAVFRAN